MKSSKRDGKRGSAFLEYALLAALIGIAAGVGVAFYGKQLKQFFMDLGNKTASVTSKSSSK